MHYIENVLVERSSCMLAFQNLEAEEGKRKRKREEQKKQKGQKKVRKGHAATPICMLFLCACTSEGGGG